MNSLLRQPGLNEETSSGIRATSVIPPYPTLSKGQSLLAAHANHAQKLWSGFARLPGAVSVPWESCIPKNCGTPSTKYGLRDKTEHTLHLGQLYLLNQHADGLLLFHRYTRGAAWAQVQGEEKVNYHTFNGHLNTSGQNIWRKVGDKDAVFTTKVANFVGPELVSSYCKHCFMELQQYDNMIQHARFLHEIIQTKGSSQMLMLLLNVLDNQPCSPVDYSKQKWANSSGNLRKFKRHNMHSKRNFDISKDLAIFV